MGASQRRKGKVGERAARDIVRAWGIDARRGQQHAGNPDAPDVVCAADLYIEAKWRAWALGILVSPPSGMDVAQWRALLEEELPRLHARGVIVATRYGVGALSYWPARHEVPVAAGAREVA